MKKQSKADQQVVKDEADATVREGARQAALERERVIRIANESAQLAAEEPTAEAAKTTFWQKFKSYFTEV